MFSSDAALFMLPALATASTILKSSASMCVLLSHASIEANQQALMQVKPTPYALDSVVGGISILGPVISRFFRGIGNPGNGLDVLKAEFYGNKEAKRCSMFHRERLTIKMCDEQRLWMTCRR